MNKFVGIDISKETFDIYFEQEGKGCHIKLQQTETDYKILLHLVGKDAIFIMVATGNLSVQCLFTITQCSTLFYQLIANSIVLF
jgi:hypothetical protein